MAVSQRNYSGQPGKNETNSRILKRASYVFQPRDPWQLYIPISSLFYFARRLCLICSEVVSARTGAPINIPPVYRGCIKILIKLKMEINLPFGPSPKEAPISRVSSEIFVSKISIIPEAAGALGNWEWNGETRDEVSHGECLSLRRWNEFVHMCVKLVKGVINLIEWKVSESTL